MSTGASQTRPFLKPVSDDPAPEISVRRATVTLAEAAQVLGISRSTAYELARTGELPVLRLGRRLVISKRALQRLLDGGEPGTG